MAYDLERSFYPHFIDADSLKIIWDEGVRGEWFYDKNVKAVFDFTIGYYIAEGFKIAPDRSLLEHHFPFIITDWEEKRSLEYVLIPDLKKKHQYNSVDDALKKTATTALDDPSLALREGTQALVDLQRMSASRERFVNYGETLPDRIDSYLAEVATGTYETFHRGYPLFWDEVTEYTNGILKGELAFLIGAANSGKSFFLAHQALHAAKSHVKTYYASLENPPEMTMARLDCLLSGVPYQKYERGLLNYAETKQLEQARDESEEWKEYLIIDMPQDANERTIVEIYARAQYEGTQLLVGDQLDWITSMTKGPVDYTKRMEQIVQDLTFATRQSDMAAIWGGQFNRTGAKKEGRKSLFDMAGTSFIERNAAWVFAISATEDQKAQECIVFDLLKTRRSASNAFLVEFSLKDETHIKYLREAQADK